MIIRYLTIAFFMVALACGCATSPKRIAYTTLKSIKQAETAAMESYYELYWTGKVNAESENKIQALHAKYLVAFEAAVQAARQNWESAPSESVVVAVTALVSAVEQLKTGQP